MAFDARRSGQAMAEFVVALLAMTLIVLAMVEFLPVMLENFGLLKDMREEAGTRSVTTESGISVADRQDAFDIDIPDLLIDKDFTSGYFTEKLRMPAANLATHETVSIPVISGATETLRYANRSRSAEFVSALSPLPPAEALARAAGTMAGAGWNAHPIEADDARLFTIGDAAAPSAVAAVHVQTSTEGDGSTVITIAARSAGGSL